MSKFKVGDKVRITNGYPVSIGDRSGQSFVGETTTITKCTKKEAYGRDSQYYYDVENHSYEWDEDALELVEEKEDKVRKFKVGDKVRLLRGTGDFPLYDFKSMEVVEIVGVGDKQFLSGDIRSGGDVRDWAVGHIPDRNHYGYVNSADIELVESKSKKPKTELRIVYKVTTEEYKSVNNGDCVLEYKLEQKTKTPKGGNPLIAFASWDTAIRFMLASMNITHGHILKCVGKVRVDDTDFSFLEGVLGGAPDGSVLCDWVFPIEQIK